MKKIALGQKVMSNILKYSYLNGISDADLAKIFEASASTISNRRKKPELITLKEIENFCMATHTPYEEIMK